MEKGKKKGFSILDKHWEGVRDDKDESVVRGIEMNIDLWDLNEDERLGIEERWGSILDEDDLKKLKS